MATFRALLLNLMQSKSKWTTNKLTRGENYSIQKKKKKTREKKKQGQAGNFKRLMKMKIIPSIDQREKNSNDRIFKSSTRGSTGMDQLVVCLPRISTCSVHVQRAD